MLKYALALIIAALTICGADLALAADSETVTILLYGNVDG